MYSSSFAFVGVVTIAVNLRKFFSRCRSDGASPMGETA
jgi:hypothetical protein